MKRLPVLKFEAVDIATLAYLLITGVFIGFNYLQIENAWIYIAVRLFMISIIFTIAKKRELGITQPFWAFLSEPYPLVFLLYLYPETGALNNVFYQNLDMTFVFFEYSIFGYQPSIEFYKHFPSSWLVELMSFGYFSFYLLLIFGLIWIYFKNQQNFSRAFFIVCSSFYVYYIIFIIYPVVGPQYFFSSPDNFVGDAGPFRWAMQLISNFAERPSGAFPSSIAGITLIMLILLFRDSKPLFLALLPFAMLSLVSSVYLKENYVIGVAAGLVSGLIFFFLFNFVYKLSLMMDKKV